MSTNEKFIESIVTTICNAEDLAEAFAMYQVFGPLVKDYKFVFASERGALPGFAVNRTFSSGAAVRGLFRTPRVFVLDPDTMLEMQSGKATYQIDYSISLDTNAMSYLTPYLSGMRKPPMPADFQEVFEFIAKPDVNVDPMPYLLENIARADASPSPDKVFSTFLSYEVLRTIDVEWLRRCGAVRSTQPQDMLAADAQQRLSKMHFDLRSPQFTNTMKFRHMFVYAYLLEMALIQLRFPRETLEEKIGQFLDFSDKKLAAIALRLTAIARAFFQRGTHIKFFRKVEKGRDDLLMQLRNMAWDIWHLCQLEEAMTYQLVEGSRYYFPAILTFDKGFIEIMDLCSVKSLAYKRGSTRPIPVYDIDFTDLLRSEDMGGVSPLEHYFYDDAVRRRAAEREQAKRSLPEVVASLERQLMALK